MNDDDFFVEDILDNNVKKKKINSKDKGRRGESDLCKVLSARFVGMAGFNRVIGSGNAWSFANLTEQAKNVMTGDIVCPEGFKFSIECKYGYAQIDLSSSFHGNKELDKFLLQSEKDADRIHRKPMLCWKKPRQKWLAFVKEDLQYKYKMTYREWSIVSLDTLLEEDDSFFF